MILIAEDDSISRRLLEAHLQKWGYEVVAVRDGLEAWAYYQEGNSPSLAIFDWMMPGMDGIELCCNIRKQVSHQPTYIILLTAKGCRSDIIEGLQNGADDYVVKPFDPEELHARVQVGMRIVELQRSLAQRISELQAAHTQVRHLEGLLPICCYCKKIRRDDNYWDQVEHYITKHSDATFSHSICPECYDRHIIPQLKSLNPEGESP